MAKPIQEKYKFRTIASGRYTNVYSFVEAQKVMHFRHRYNTFYSFVEAQEVMHFRHGYTTVYSFVEAQKVMHFVART